MDKRRASLQRIVKGDLEALSHENGREGVRHCLVKVGGVACKIAPDLLCPLDGLFVLDPDNLLVKEGDVEVLNTVDLDIKLCVALPSGSNVYDGRDMEVAPDLLNVALSWLVEGTAPYEKPGSHRFATIYRNTTQITGVLDSLKLDDSHKAITPLNHKPYNCIFQMTVAAKCFNPFRCALFLYNLFGTGKGSRCLREASMSRYAIGIICALSGAILWGFSGCCAQLLTQVYGMSAFLLTMVRMPIATCVFAVVFALRYRETLSKMVRDRGTLRGCAIFGCCGLFTCQLTYIVAISYTNAGTGTVLEQFSIVIIMVVACILARKLPNRFEVLGLICAFGAVLLIATRGDFSTLAIGGAGLAWGLAAAVATTIYVMYPKKLLERWGSLPVTGLGTTFGAVICIGVGIVSALWCALDPSGTGWIVQAWTFPSLDVFGWLAFAVTTLVGTFLAFILYLRGVQYIGQIRGSQLGAAEPASAAIFAAVWLATPFTWADWVGLVLMIATVFLMSVANKS